MMLIKGRAMSKIAALLSDEEIAENATDRLAKLKIDDLTWELVRKEDDMDRILPVMAWPAGNSAQGGGVSVGIATRTDYPKAEALEERGAADEDADFYAQSVAHGATAIIVEVPEEYRGQVRAALEQAGATRISWE
jgi:hypothetical protein